MKAKIQTTLTLRYHPSLEECVVRFRPRAYRNSTVTADALLASWFARPPAALRLDALWANAIRRSGVL